MGVAEYKFDADDIAQACDDPVFIAFCRACEEYRKRAGEGVPVAASGHPAAPDPDFEYFDPDELGVDPEKDEEVWY